MIVISNATPLIFLGKLNAVHLMAGTQQASLFADEPQPLIREK